MNNHLNYEFFHKKIKILIIWCNLHVLHCYVYTNETNIFKFWYNVFKKFSECLIRNQLSTKILAHLFLRQQLLNPHHHLTLITKWYNSDHTFTLYTYNFYFYVFFKSIKEDFRIITSLSSSKSVPSSFGRHPLLTTHLSRTNSSNQFLLLHLMV